MAYKARMLLQLFSRLVLSVFGLGYMPFAPGTFGSIPGLILCFFWGRYGTWLLPILFAISYFLIRVRKDDTTAQDPQWIVIDEVIGMGVACWIYFQYYHCYHWLGLLLLFLFFRLFDILKPFPIGWTEARTRQLDIPLSILLDDVVAGIFAGLCVLFVMPPMIAH